MNEELNQLLEGLSEEQKAKFMEKVKKDAEVAVKTAAAEKEKEEAKKLFKATGNWETETSDYKFKATINDDSKKFVDITFVDHNAPKCDKSYDGITMRLKKEEFFNFVKMLNDVYSSVKEENTEENENSVLDALREWQKKMSEENDFGSWWRKYAEGLDKIFYPGGFWPRQGRSRIFHIR